MKYLDPRNAPFRIFGLPFLAEDRVYRRFPLNPPFALPEAVNNLAWNPSGGQIHFRARMKELAVKAVMAAPSGMGNMCPMGQSGIDCYLRDIEADDTLRHYSTVCPKPPTKEKVIDDSLLSSETARTYDVVLNLPLYMRMNELELGFDDDAEISEPAVLPQKGRIVFYGGSVTQGGCASRPGLSYTNILSRWMNRECINYGFSGSGKAEDEVAEAVVLTDDAAMFVINTMGNCANGDYVREHYPRFISILRRRYPDVPILLWTFATMGRIRYNKANRDNFEGKVEAERDVYEQLKASGDRNIYLARADYSDEFMGNDITSEFSMDGTHPNDHGMILTAKKLLPILNELLSK